MTEDFLTYMNQGLASIGMTLNDEQLNTFYIFYEDLIETNKVMNLTAITELKDVVFKHFIDSLALIKAVPDIQTKPYTIMDLGTGAGFPGIPLAIACPQLKLTLLDSLNKRINFINQEAEKLGISGITAVHGRAEDMASDKLYRETFDLCVSRAVANLSTLSEYCLPFVHKGGSFIPYKSASTDSEISASQRAMSVLGGKLRDIVRFTLYEEDAERTLIIVDKVLTTPKKYPRKAGIPSKEPI